MWFVPDWPSPPGVRAAITTRAGGLSSGPWSSFNLGDHVGDDAACVAENRLRLVQRLQLPAMPQWLDQVHGTDVVELATEVPGQLRADAAWTRSVNTPCVVLTADCLPVIFCDQEASVVAVSHAGWRGLVAGVLERTIQAMAAPSSRILAYLGPAISQRYFEVGEEVRMAFVQAAAPGPERDATETCFVPAHRPNHYFADLYGLARLRLRRAGVTAVYGGDDCTYADNHRFYSYRRDGVTGRMATLVWLVNQSKSGCSA